MGICPSKHAFVVAPADPPEYADRAMDLVREPEGSVMFGWLAPGVFFARFAGRLSAAMGEAHVAALQRAVDTTPTIQYFADCNQLSSYDLMARSGFVRVLLSNRKKFRDIVIWDWSGSPTQNGKTLAETVGEPVISLSDRVEFERRLSLAAPSHAWVLRMAPDAANRDKPLTETTPRDRS